MKRHRSSLSIVLALFLVPLAAHAQVRPADAADTVMLNRIWLEGTNNSRVMEHMSWITDVFGPRIPGSPAYDKAAEWLHHTNQDVYDHAVPEDLVQSAVVMAYFVYQTAMREDMLPRKPLAIPVEMPAKAK
ncbi:MAG: hypothetical protein ACXW2O_02260 [Candidatus Aminicenantales bacterium]